MSRSDKKPKAIQSLRDLVPDERNANKGTERGLGLLDESLRRYGAGRSILADKNGRIIAGNKTLDRAAELGLPVRVVETDGTELVVVQRKDLDLKRDKAAKELAIADNRVAEVNLDWDPEVLKALQDDGVDLAAFFLPDELEELLDGEGGGAGVEEDDVPTPDQASELQAKWGTARGQVWIIPSKEQPNREHRLMCGDSTDAQDVARLVGSDRPVFMWTDPPYGVEYTGKTKDALTIQNDGAEGLPELLRAAFSCTSQVLAAGSPVYVCHPAGRLFLEFGRAFVEAGWKLHQTLIWVKDAFVLGHSHYHFQHEPILYGWTPGEHRWYGGRDKASVLAFDRPRVNDEHPTSKPVALVAHCISNSSKPGDVGYEPFCGSGTTLLAAEQVGRLCLAMELDPRYVAVTLERLAALGLEPRLTAGDAA